MSNLICVRFMMRSGYYMEVFMSPNEVRDLIDSYIKGDTNNIIGDSNPPAGYPAWCVNLKDVEGIMTIPVSVS
jgi:hypothetical protein